MSETKRIRVMCRQVPVVIEYGDGKEEECTIREMMGDASDDYMQSVQDKLEFESDSEGKFRVSGIKSFKGLYSSLLKCTLFHESGEVFSENEVGKLSTSAQKELFNIAQDLNAMTEEAKEKAKNA